MPYKDPQKQKEAQHRHYLNNKKQYRQRAIQRRKDNKAYVQRYLKKHQCQKCGETDILCLDFHHTNNNNKVKNISQLVRNGVSLTTLQIEIDKCIVLCANCHNDHHHNKNKEPIHYGAKWLRKYKLTIKCGECGHKGIASLHFHHTEDNKDGNIGHLATHAGIKNIQKEIDKCIVICANCHRKIHQ